MSFNGKLNLFSKKSLIIGLPQGVLSIDSLGLLCSGLGARI